ncbi:hypothetical protein ACLMJK_005225 [Lecanora helva]
MFMSPNPSVPIQPAPSIGNQSPQRRQSPQSFSKKSSTTQSQQPKLRLSCDACAAAKVKCSKERPRCERCVLNDTSCVYGPSMKHGKPERKRRLQEHQAANGIPIQQRPSATARWEHGFESNIQKSLTDIMQPTGNAFGNAFGTPTMQNATSNDANALSPNSLPNAPFTTFDNGLMLDSLSSSRTNSPMIGSQNDSPSNPNTSNDIFAQFDQSAAWLSSLDFSHLMNQDISTGSRSQPSNSPSVLDQSKGGLLSHSTSQNERHDCESVANTTLANLQLKSKAPPGESNVQSCSPHTLSPSVLSNNCSTVQAYEDLFRVNQEATSNVSQMLSCSCASDPHMAVLYASIIIKVLYWYQVAAGIKSFDSCDHGSPKPTDTPAWSASGSLPNFEKPWAAGHSKSSSCSHDETFVAREPFRIGTYTPDEEDQEPMRRMLLMSNLRKVGRLIESLARIGEKADQGTSNLHSMLGAWLKSELSRTIQKGTNGMEPSVCP